MKLQDVINLVDRSPSNETEADYGSLCEVLQVEEAYAYGTWDKVSENIKAYYLTKWLCTDTWVGSVVYFMEGEPVAVSFQLARKSSKDYYFVNQDKAEKVRKFLLSLVPSPVNTLNFIDEEMVCPEHYSVEWAGQLLTSEGFADGRPCTIINKDNSFLGKHVTVKFAGGEEKEIEVSEFLIPYHIKA